MTCANFISNIGTDRRVSFISLHLGLKIVYFVFIFNYDLNVDTINAYW